MLVVVPSSTGSGGKDVQVWMKKKDASRLYQANSELWSEIHSYYQPFTPSSQGQ